MNNLQYEKIRKFKLTMQNLGKYRRKEMVSREPPPLFGLPPINNKSAAN
jgi:hypothetical protein